MYKVTHLFTCKECGEEYAQSYASATVINPIAVLPVGWAQLQDGYVCPNHIITITNKPVEETVE